MRLGRVLVSFNATQERENLRHKRFRPIITLYERTGTQTLETHLNIFCVYGRTDARASVWMYITRSDKIIYRIIHHTRRLLTSREHAVFRIFKWFFILSGTSCDYTPRLRYRRYRTIPQQRDHVNANRQKQWTEVLAVTTYYTVTARRVSGILRTCVRTYVFRFQRIILCHGVGLRKSANIVTFTSCQMGFLRFAARRRISTVTSTGVYRPTRAASYLCERNSNVSNCLRFICFVVVDCVCVRTSMIR